MLDPKTSQRIFELAKDQQEELESLPDDEDDELPDEAQTKYRSPDNEYDEDEEVMSERSIDAEEYAEFVRRAAAQSTLFINSYI